MSQPHRPGAFLSKPGLPCSGDVIAGRFQVERVIGAGGMGCVVAALDTASGQRVAVKTILPEHIDDLEFNARFEREVQVAGALRSEHVPRVLLASHAADGTPYMVMELLEGTGLEKLLRRGRKLPFAQAVAYMIEACDAIAEAHANGIVHRDLKPSNLFLADSWLRLQTRRFETRKPQPGGQGLSVHG